MTVALEVLEFLTRINHRYCCKSINMLCVPIVTLKLWSFISVVGLII